MIKDILNISFAALVVFLLAVLSIYIETSYVGVMIALAADQTEGDFRQILLYYGVGINSLGGITFLLWYFFGPKLYQMDSLRFNMGIVWFVVFMLLFILGFSISLAMKSLIDWDATALSYSYLLLLVYPISCTVSFWISSAFFSPNVLKYFPPMSKQTRKIYN
ncbi:MAG: hypothetical protein PF495_16945 [Spirochaetales bacterium]|jgi:hypothetical protein|nr:hypothetical protein [Spirochaetales bacterium]